MILTALLMVSSYSMVASSSQRNWQLLGVVLSAAQGGLGEASCLGLCSRYGGRGAVSAWSSGTGHPSSPEQLLPHSVMLPCASVTLKGAAGLHSSKAFPYPAMPA